MDKRRIKRLVCSWAAELISSELGNGIVQGVVDESPGLFEKDEERVRGAFEELISELERRGKEE